MRGRCVKFLVQSRGLAIFTAWRPVVLLNPRAAHLLRGGIALAWQFYTKTGGLSLTGVWARLGANGQGRTSKPRSGVLGMLWGVRTQKLGAGFPMCHTSHWRLPHACGPQLSHLEKEVPFREDGLWPGVDGKHEALCTRGSAQPLAGSR